MSERGHECSARLMFSVIRAFYCALMNAPLVLFLQKKRNALQNINKSFNLLIPCAKPKSHIYLAQNKTLMTNVIFVLTLPDDVWSHLLVSAMFGG